MSYAQYDLPNGEQGGYAVSTECGLDSCHTLISRDLAALCGAYPTGQRADDLPGCGGYFCGYHSTYEGHQCPNPEIPTDA